MIASIQSLFGFTTPTKTKVALTGLDNSTFDRERCVVRSIPEEFCYQDRSGRRQFAVVIDNLLTAEECAQWIADTEAIGYEQALVNVGNGKQILMADYRKSLRCVVDDEQRVAEVWQRLQSFLPEDMCFHDNYIPRELNERLRFLRYDAGDYFQPHMDGCYEHPPGHSKAGDCSFVTFQLYLNEGFTGGSTRVFTKRDSPQYTDVVPKTGSVFLFEHRMMHSGEPVTEGRKYAVRMDIMFTRRAPSKNTTENNDDEDQETDGPITEQW